MATLAPISISIRTYQVGFGDCYLLQFRYSGNVSRHVLIDFGTTGVPAGTASALMKAVALDIGKRCKQKLDMVVATHRHADHISGFATNTAGTAAGDLIRSYKPRLIVQPWTEAPNLATRAVGPVDRSDVEGMRSFTSALSAMHSISQSVLDHVSSPAGRRLSPAVAAQLRFLGEDNLKNASAVRNLMTMGKRQAYVHHGSRLALASILPGVKVHVLGPPTLRQSKEIKSQRSSDPNEFWQLAMRQVNSNADEDSPAGELFPNFASEPGGKLRFSARWLAQRMKEIPGEQLLQLVRVLDKQMNNTSLILLFETAKRKLLFPGDAQIENWNYALSREENAALLADVDLYKVGHHGSRNATPRRLWAMFTKRGPAKTKGRLTSIMSTMPGKHGNPKSKTEVPRGSLVKALQAESDFHSTHLLPDGVEYFDVDL